MSTSTPTDGAPLMARHKAIVEARRLVATGKTRPDEHSRSIPIWTAEDMRRLQDEVLPALIEAAMKNRAPHAHDWGG